MIPREEKIKLNKNENSIGHGHLPVGCLQKNSPATKQSWIAEQQPKRNLLLYGKDNISTLKAVHILS